MSAVGYSGTPLLKKPGIQPEMKILLINEPDNYFTLLETDISEQVIKKNGSPDLVHLFVKNNKGFEVEMKKLPFDKLRVNLRQMLQKTRSEIMH